MLLGDFALVLLYLCLPFWGLLLREASSGACGLPHFGERGDWPYCWKVTQRVRQALAKWFLPPHLLHVNPHARHGNPWHPLSLHLPHSCHAGDLLGVRGPLLLAGPLFAPVFGWRPEGGGVHVGCWKRGPLLRCWPRGRRCWGRLLRGGCGRLVLASWSAVMRRSNCCNCAVTAFSASNWGLGSATRLSLATTANFNKSYTDSGAAMARWGRSSVLVPLMPTSTTSLLGTSIWRAICCILPRYILKDSPGSCLLE